MAKKNEKVNLKTNYYIMMPKAQMIVEEGKCFIEVTEDQFDRIKASYESGNYKRMDEDESVHDVYETHESNIKTSEKQVILFDYPKDIRDGKTFEECADNKSVVEEVDDWMESIINKAVGKTDASMDRLAGTREEENTRDEAISELQDWMVEHGFDAGEYGCPLEDEEGWAVDSVDLGWPHGLYGTKGYTKPVAVQFYHTTPELLELARKNGFEVFESVEEFKEFIGKISN